MYQYLEEVKEAVGDTGGYNDGAIRVFINEVIEDMVDSGVKREVAMSERAIGVVAVGLNDLWTNAPGKVIHSPYYTDRCIKLSLIKEVDTNTELEKYKKITEALMEKVEGMCDVDKLYEKYVTGKEKIQTFGEEIQPLGEFGEECIIDCEKRTITIPENLKIAGVEDDNRVKRIYFRCRKKAQIADLSQKEPYIVYRNAKGEPDFYHCTDKNIDGEEVTFSWLISDFATKYKGKIKFLVYMRGGEGKKWHTTLHDLEVLEGMVVSEEIVERNPDWIVQIMEEIDKLKEEIKNAGTIDKEQIKSAVGEYMEENPVIVEDGTITKEKLADKAVTYEKMQLSVPGGKNTINVDGGANGTGSANASSGIEYDDIIAMVGNYEKFYIRGITTDDFAYSSFVLRLVGKTGIYGWNSATNCPMTQITTFVDATNYGGTRERIYEVIVSDFIKWYEENVEKFYTLENAVIGSEKIQLFSSSSRYRSAVIIGVIEDYGSDYLLYDEFTSDVVNKEFETLIKQIVGEDSESGEDDALLSTVEKIVKKHLEGKTIIFMGDSYTAGASSQFSTLCQKYGATADNRGIVSSSICGDTTGSKGFKPMWDRTVSVCNEYKEAGTVDVVGAIVFMGGANDGHSQDNWIGSGINDRDNNHIYGAMHTILKTFRDTFAVPIFVILQPTFPNGNTGNIGCDLETAKLWGFDSVEQCESFDADMWSQYTMTKKQIAVKKIAEFYNGQITDCFFNYDISIFSKTDRTKYWTADGHPNATGYQHIADKLEEKIKEILGK